MDEATLRARLREIAERGWAENREESRVGVVSVGAPVRDGDGVVIAALCVAAPDRPGGRRPPCARIRAAVLEAGRVICRRLGRTALNRQVVELTGRTVVRRVGGRLPRTRSSSS